MGIHLAFALPLLAWNAGVRLVNGGAGAEPDSVVHAAMLQEEDRSGMVASSMGPCERKFIGEHLAADERLISSANLPASVIAGWFDPCPAPWTVSALINPERRYGKAMAAALTAAYAGIIALQWFLLGAFARSQSAKRLRDPGAVITVCFIAGAVPLLAFDAVGLVRWLRSGAYAPIRSAEVVIAFSDLMSICMVLAWSGWTLLLLTSLLRRARGALTGHAVSSE